MSLVLQTRRRNLELALSEVQQTLSDVPNLSRQLESIKKGIASRVEKTREQDRLILDWRWGPGKSDEERKLAGFITDLLDCIRDLGDQLAVLEKGSFFVQVSETGLSRKWLDELRALAVSLRTKAVDAKDWQRLATIEARARDDLFGRSLELLGGLALRDSRLNADLCELADDLVWAMGAVETRHFAIMGGLHSKLMRLERIVRLPFPLWSVWDLPFAAHDFWHANGAAAKNVRDRALEQGDCPIAKSDMDAVLADVLATNSLGPAYGYAALTLWFAPSEPRFDLRVRAICAMLRTMNDKKPKGVTASYLTVSDDLGAAWGDAVGEARPAGAAHRAPLEENDFQQLLAAFADQAQQCGLDQDRGRAALIAARQQSAAPAAASSAPSDAELETVCGALIDGIRGAGYKQFQRQDWQGLPEWNEIERWRDLSGEEIQKATGGAIDLRHLLNAAWKERVKADDFGDAALTDTLTKLAKGVRPRREKR
jgi:hypothetical protein